MINGLGPVPKQRQYNSYAMTLTLTIKYERIIYIYQTPVLMIVI